MNEKSNIIDVDESSFNEQVMEASDSKLVLVDFWAPWCGPCKQLTPLLEKVVNKSKDKIILAKINIDENQQISTQLRIQSIPVVFAFKNKKLVNAFQGVIPEKQIIDFVEKALGEKLEKDFSEFFEKIENDIKEKNFLQAKDLLLDFIAENPKEYKAISLYLITLIELKEFSEAQEFVSSLDDEASDNNDIKSATKRLNLAKKNEEGPTIQSLEEKLNTKPKDINLICEIAEKYFGNNEYEKAFGLLFEAYPKNKNIVKNKVIEFFNALGQSHEITIDYRKKFSQIMFS